MAGEGKKRKGKSELEIGEWHVRRIGDNQIHLTLPAGLVLAPKKSMSIEDVLSTIANYYLIKKGVIPACCGANEMVA